MVPKTNDELLRLVVDMSHLTETFSKLKMRIPPFHVMFRGLPEGIELSAIRIDLTGAFYQIKLADSATRLSTFKYLENHYCVNTNGHKAIACNHTMMFNVNPNRYKIKVV